VKKKDCPPSKTNITIGSKIKFPNNEYMKQCLDLTSTSKFYSEDPYHQKLFDSVSLPIIEPDDYEYTNLNFLDYLFYSSTRVEDANIIRIENRTQLSKLENILESYHWQTEKIKSKNKYSNLINNLIRSYSKSKDFGKISSLIKNNFDESVLAQELNDNRALVDDRISEMVISSFLLNEDLDKMGLLTHKYYATNSVVSTYINHFSLEIEYFQGDTQRIIEYAYLVVSFLLVLCFYLKYILRGLDQVITASRYFLLFINIFIIEKIFVIYHLFQGTDNLFFKPLCAYDIDLRERFIYYKDNIKFFKALAAMSISIHMNFVIFPHEDLFIIKKLFTQVIILFFIIIIIVSLSLTMVLNFYFGLRMGEFNKILDTFIKVFGFILGIEIISTQNEQENSYTRIAKSVMFIIRLIYTNFTIVVMTYTYNHLMEKKNNQKLLESKRIKTKSN